MEAKAIARHLRVTPMKARRVVDLVRGKQATEALAILKFAQQGASEPVYKLVASAVANARVKADREGQAFDLTWRQLGGNAAPPTLERRIGPGRTRLVLPWSEE